MEDHLLILLVNHDRFNFILSGKIPLRQLVYRVLDLPPSLRPLVYDFGQLNVNAEESYIEQIVLNHVRIVYVYLSMC